MSVQPRVVEKLLPSQDRLKRDLAVEQRDDSGVIGPWHAHVGLRLKILARSAQRAHHFKTGPHKGE